MTRFLRPLAILAAVYGLAHAVSAQTMLTTAGGGVRAGQAFTGKLLAGNGSNNGYCFAAAATTCLYYDDGVPAITVAIADDPRIQIDASTTTFAGTVSSPTVTGSSAYRLGAVLTISATDPTIASGFGVGAAVANANGTAAFEVNVGTGGTATSGVLTMPAATTGWICHVENRTGVLANVANQRTIQIATTTTSVTVENQTISTGAVLAWTASDVLVLSCDGY